MQIGILSGAFKNAGDFLIEKRSVDLIRSCYPDAEIVKFQRNLPLDGELERLNQCDFIVFAGGPAFQPAIYPNEMPLVDDLNRIKPPIYSLGVGWHAKYIDDLYTIYRFTDKTRLFIDRLGQDAPLSCRDWYTVRALQENGYSNCVMTGCPAWYCIDVLEEKTEERKGVSGETICVSDPARKKNLDLVVPLVKTVKKKFPNSPIVYVMHRDKMNGGRIKENYYKQLCALYNELEELEVKIICIENGVDGFSIYDDCKFHIGFRVHAHIYNLSRGGHSILINEDARGMGVNDALGVENINMETLVRVAENRTGKVKLAVEAKDFVSIFQRKVEYCLDMNVQTDWLPCKRAWMSIKKYYDTMRDYITSWYKE